MQFRKGLAKIHKHNTEKKAASEKKTEHHDCNKCNDQSKTTNVHLKEDVKKTTQSKLCNEKSINPANFTTTTLNNNHVTTKKSTGTICGHISDTSVLIKEHTQLRTLSGSMVHESHPQVLQISDEMTEKVLAEIDNLGVATNQRIEVSANQCSLHQKPAGSKLDDEFLKETHNIPVVGNIDSTLKRGEATKHPSSTDDPLKSVKKQKQCKNTVAEGHQKSKLHSGKVDTKGQKKPLKVERSHVRGDEVELVSVKEEALEFMHGVMDAATFVGNFSTPVDTSLIIVITARQDAYVPRDKVPSLQELWPGIEVSFYCHEW